MTASPPRHRLLQRQLRTNIGGLGALGALDGLDGLGVDPAHLEGWAAFLDAVNDAYCQADIERRLLENALDVSAQELTEANVKLRLLIDHAPTGMAMLDRELRILFVSRRWLQDRGLERYDVIGRNIYEAYPLAAHWKEVHGRCLGGATERSAGEAVARPGGVRWISWEVRPWYERDNEVGGIILVSEDVTERLVAEERLRIAAVAFQSRDGMLVTDTHGTILQVNSTFTDVTGYTAEEAVGKTPALLRSGRHDAVFYRALWEAISREGHWAGEIWNRRKDGGIYPEWLAITGVRDAAGAFTHFLANFSDISEPKEAERRILELAFYDPLTTLPNRRLLLDRLNQGLLASTRSGQCGAVLLLDLDHFKTLNDTRGHDVGDELLIEVAHRLRAALRDSDSAARLGGDEFVVLLERLHEDNLLAGTLAETIAEKLRTAIAQPVILKGEVYHFTSSIGVTLFRGSLEPSEGLLKQADLALYQAKAAGRNVTRFFNPVMQAAVDERVDLESGLRRALEQGEFLLHYQPQVDAARGLVGAEALVRWQPPDRALVPPAAFIPVAEDCGLIIPIGAWVLGAACRQLALWADHPATRNLTLAINVSARQFQHPGFVDQVLQALRESGANPVRLELEITESLFLGDAEKLIPAMRTLKDMGIRFSLDDFGTGYSSLSYLKRLPLNQLKIDQSFVRDIAEDGDDRAIVQAIISLATNLGLEVIAEGVETREQRDFLASHGCTLFQGYLYGRPGPVEQLLTGK